MAMLEIRNIVKKFGGLVAVNDLSFGVEEHKIHALIGPNGSGKSTTINMINGTFPASSGQIYFAGEEITGLPMHEVCRRGIGRTFQNLNLFHSMTVEENLMVGLYHSSKISLPRFIIDFIGVKAEEKQMREQAHEMMKFIGIEKYSDRVVRNLPYGRQKMTELARTMMTKPQLILLDEPAAGLNPSERSEFIDIIKRINATGVTILMIEHNMDVIMNISEMITVINFGKKIAKGTCTEVQSHPDVIKAYLGDRYKVINTGG